MGNENTKTKGTEKYNREALQAKTERRLRPEVKQHRAESSGEMSFEASSRSKHHQRFQKSQIEENEELGDLKDNPWRHLERKGSWHEEYTELLLDNIRNNIKINDKDVKNIRILLIGPVKAGKSSFINTVASIDKGRSSQVTVAGGAVSSMTSKLKVFRPTGRLKNFRLLDTMGLEETNIGGFNVKDLLYVVKGHVPPDYKFNPASPIDEESRDFVGRPKKKDKIHCVVFVIDANVVGQDNIPDASRMKIKALQEELRNQEIPRIVLLTKIDVLCEMIDTDITNCYRSAAMMKTVNLAAELFNVPEQNIFPVQNFSNEMDMDPNKEILHLLALRQMIYFGTDFLNELSAKTSDDEDSS